MEDALAVVKALRDAAVAHRHEDAEQLRHDFSRILMPLLRPPPRRARKVGGDYQADGWLLGEFRTLAGQRMAVFEFELIPSVMVVLPRNMLLVMPDMAPPNDA